MVRLIYFVEFVVLVGSVFFGIKWWNDPGGNYEPVLFLGGIVLLVTERLLRRYGSAIFKKDGKLATLFPWIKSYLYRPIILPHQRQNWWHMGRTGDAKPAMQLASYWYATNITDQPMSIFNCYIKSPWIQGQVLLKDTSSPCFGKFPIPPNSTTELHADFWIVPPIQKEGKDLKLDVVFVDQNGQKRILRQTFFRSDRKKTSKVKALAQEAVYTLSHNIEKHVVGILKDEISRYKKYGRESGQLGSIYAEYIGRKIKSIYQDSWTSSRSGERQEIVRDPQNSHISCENGDTLVQYFETLQSKNDKKIFLESLTSRLSREKEYYCVSYLILYVLFRVGRLEEGLKAVESGLSKQRSLWDIILFKKTDEGSFEKFQRHGYGDLLGMINGLLRYEHGSFSNDDLDLIEEFIHKTDEYTFSIDEKLNSIRAYRLAS
ncbi:hypothetical protein [Emcibacter sp.]|uniref:hypothetical protein n=1 Tax=Emcibacter sp. TaxID=1979954 RepID=UPI003A946B4B